MKKKLMALFLAAVILFTYFPRVYAAGSIWFIAVNDSVPKTMTDETEPYLDGETLYIPYTAFRAKPFGIFISYNEDKKENLTLFNRAKRLHIDLLKETCTDKDGNVTALNVVFKNGVVYLPAYCLSYFGVQVTLLKNVDGYLVLRFTNGNQAYDNDVLLAKAERLIKYNAERYDNGTFQPGTDISDVEDPDSDLPFNPGDEPEGYAYVAFRGEAVSELSLKLLEAENLRAAFFLTLEQIQEYPELVRMMYAAGNTIGITINGMEDNLQLVIDQANDALDNTIFRKTILVLLPEERASEVQGYRVIEIPSLPQGKTDQPSDGLLNEGEEATQTQFFVIEEPNVNNTLSQLLGEGIKILQLRESTVIIQ